MFSKFKLEQDPSDKDMLLFQIPKLLVHDIKYQGRPPMLEKLLADALMSKLDGIDMDVHVLKSVEKSVEKSVDMEVKPKPPKRPGRVAVSN